MVLAYADLDLPLVPERIFGRTAPVVVEVGIGSGRFLDALAEAHPDWNVLGVERSSASVVRTYRRLRTGGRTHARLFAGTVQFALRNLISPGGLHRLYVNFPDPWPREKHRHKRFLNQTFFRLLSTRLEDGGCLLLTSDHPGYFRTAVAEAEATGLYRVVPGEPPVMAMETKYAQKWQQQQRNMHHAAFIQTRRDSAAFTPTIRLEEMHHALLHGTLPDLSEFAKQVHPFDHGHIVLLTAYRSLDGRGLAFLVHLEENDLTQEVIVEARPHEDGILVGLKRFGDPLFTRGINRAVHVVTEYLAGQGMTVAYRRYREG